MLTYYSAALSTILGIITIYKAWKERFKLEATFSSGYQSHKIRLTNLFRNPISIDSFELFWAKDIKDESDWIFIEKGFEEECELSLSAYIGKSFEFTEQYFFSLKRNFGNLYLRLHVVGRKRFVIKELFTNEY